MKKILLLSDLSREPDRQTIRGITRYTKNGEEWVTYHLPSFMRDDRSYIPEIIERARKLKVDAVFGAWPAVENGMDVDLDIPIVLKPTRTRVKGFSEFHSDSEKIARMAVDFFESLGLNHMTFSGMPGRVWSAGREFCFRKHAGKKFLPGICFSCSQPDYDKVSLWLEKLPKPVGIFCCNDVNAGMLVEICISIGIRIPEDVAILGVDDDEFLCNITSPSISSIKLDYEGAGYRIASELVSSISSGRKESFVITHGPVCIVERSSTPSRVVRDPYVRSVVEFMKEHFGEGIGIREAIEPIPLSRRSIELRFKKEFPSSTMLGYLMTLKIGRMKELLSSTGLPLSEIAFRSGFSDSENIYRLFRKQVGCSPAEYRSAHLSIVSEN